MTTKYKWTKLAKDCYMIGCRCSKCDFVEPHLTKICQVKKVVLELVREFGVPEDVRNENLNKNNYCIIE